MTTSEETPARGTGDGGTAGTPTQDAKEAPPSADQDTNMVVSGCEVPAPLR